MKRFVISITARSLAAFIALSFLATLLPAGAVVAQSVMACCRGKSASHCHSGINSKKSASISQPCHSDCCAYFAPAKQQKHERGTPQPIAKLLSPRAVLKPSSSGITILSTNDQWAKISPRGPPAFLL
jgi:hypothetical protein